MPTDAQSSQACKQCRGEVAATSPQSPAGLGEVAETSPQSRVKLVSATSPQLMETSRIRLRDLLETEKVSPKSNMFDFPRLPGDPASLQEWRRCGDVSAKRRLETSRQAVSRPVR